MSLQTAAVTAPGELEAFARFCSALTTQQGRPLALEDFQLAMLADYFGGVVETLILLSKKNGKTTLLAALALFHVCTTPDAECVIGAASRDQATILYDQAVGFIARSEGLQTRVVAKRGYREIRSRRDAGRIRVLAADVDTADGIIPTLALVDELHRHKSADLYGVFRDGLGPRHGRMVTISTAGESELSPLGQIRMVARQLPLVRDGKYVRGRAEDDSFAFHEWSLDRDDDTDDIALVKQVNPSSWQTIELLAQRHRSPSTMPWQWARFACGIWTGAESWWITPEDWAALDGNDALAPGDAVTLGFDGSRYHDATALVACRISDGLVQPLGVWEAPKGVHEWEVPAGEVDARIGEAFATYSVVRAYLDPPLWQSEIDGWAREFGDETVLRYPTNRSRFMAATERFRTDVASGTLRHNGDARLARHVLGAAIRVVRGGYWLEKSTIGEHIDVAVAAILAYEARCDLVASGWRPRSRVPVSF